MIYRNSEGYPDPTAGEAIANIIREETRIARSMRRKAERKHRKKKTAHLRAGKEKPNGNE